MVVTGEGEGFSVTCTGTNAKVPAAIPPLLSAELNPEQPVDAHKIQPFYTGLLAKDCALALSMAMDGETVRVAAVSTGAAAAPAVAPGVPLTAG